MLTNKQRYKQTTNHDEDEERLQDARVVREARHEASHVAPDCG